MAFQLREGQGSLFKNDKEGGNPNWPDYRGDALIDGKAYQISGWIKPTKTGAKFMSLSIQPKREREARHREDPPPPNAGRDEFNDEIPF